MNRSRRIWRCMEGACLLRGVAKNSCGNFPPTCYSDRMISSAVQTMPQVNKAQQAEQEFARLMADASRRGFYGTAGLILAIQDGRIQHIRVAMERMIK